MFPSRIPVAHAHPAPWPVAIVIQPRADRKADSKRQSWSEIRCIRLHIHNFRIVSRHIDQFGFCRHDANAVFFLHDPLLWSIDKVARGYCLGSELLNGIHHVSRLVKKGLADLRRPLKILIHPFYDVRITEERLDTLVPRLIRDLRRIAVCGNIARGKHQIGRHRRGRQDQGDESIRIERDGSKQLIERFLRERSAQRSPVSPVKVMVVAELAPAGNPGEENKSAE